MAIELAIYYTPMHFLWGVKSGATPAVAITFQHWEQAISAG